MSKPEKNPSRVNAALSVKTNLKAGSFAGLVKEKKKKKKEGD